MASGNPNWDPKFLVHDRFERLLFFSASDLTHKSPTNQGSSVLSTLEVCLIRRRRLATTHSCNSSTFFSSAFSIRFSHRSPGFFVLVALSFILFSSAFQTFDCRFLEQPQKQPRDSLFLRTYIPFGLDEKHPRSSHCLAHYSSVLQSRSDVANFKPFVRFIIP